MAHINTLTRFAILKTDCNCITIILDTSHEKYMVMFYLFFLLFFFLRFERITFIFFYFFIIFFIFFYF